MMFRPRDGYDQKVIGEKLTIAPEPTQIRRLHDVFGNFVAVASFDARADEIWALDPDPPRMIAHPDPNRVWTSDL
jgi:hypothetical protein